MARTAEGRSGRAVIRVLENVLIYGLLITACLSVLLPILWIIRTSMVNRLVAYQIPPDWSAPLTWENYQSLLSSGDFLRFYGNSITIGLLSTVLSVILAAAAGYGIARLRSRAAPVLSAAILSTQIIPPMVLAVPLFMVVRQLDLWDTHLALILTYTGFHLPILIWLMIGFFQGIPTAVEEAAMVDGCTRFQALWKVVLPMAAPGVAAAAILSFILCWNEFPLALVLTGIDSRTMAVHLSTFDTHRGVLISELAAATALTIVPIVALSLLIQKYLVRGLTFGAVK